MTSSDRYSLFAIVAQLCWWLCAPAAAQPAQNAPPPAVAASSVIVRASINPEAEAVIGQPVRLWIDVLFPGEMPHPPRVAPPTVAGAQVFRFETQAVTISDQVDGTSYVGQRSEFEIYPRRGGELVIPAATVTLLDRSQNETGTAASPTLPLRVSVPPDIDPTQPVIASTAFTMTEEWSPAQDSTFKVGDALQRKLTRRADAIPGSIFATFDFAAPEGVRVYVDPPQIDDKTDRGSLTGQRLDRATYVFEKAGDFTIPGIVQRWWDLEGKAVRVIETPSRRVTAAAVQPTASDGVAQPSRRGAALGTWAAVAIGAAVAGVIGIVFVPQLRPRIAAMTAEWRRRRAASEPVAFRRLQQACTTGDAAQTYRAVTDWRASIATRPELPAFIGSADAAVWCERLEGSLFGGDARPRWTEDDGRGLAEALRLARRNTGAGTARPRSSALPPLNPAAAARTSEGRR